jgi:hypothetical protein
MRISGILFWIVGLIVIYTGVTALNFCVMSLKLGGTFLVAVNGTQLVNLNLLVCISGLIVSLVLIAVGAIILNAA